MQKSNVAVSAFTTVNHGLVRRLISKASVLYDGKSINVTALWDTGATGTCISQEVVNNLKLKPTGIKKIQTPSGEDIVNTYLVDIVLPNNVIIKDVQVCDSKIGEQQIDALIGMDIINIGDFSVSNCNHKTVFSFRTPSIQTTDYVKEIKIANLIGPKHGKGNKKRRR